MRRVTRGDLDILLAHTDAGHRGDSRTAARTCRRRSRSGSWTAASSRARSIAGEFDLRDGSTVVFPTTGGLDADGNAHEPWSPPGSPPKPPPADTKALARSLTRVRRIRYLPLTIVDGSIAIRLPR